MTKILIGSAAKKQAKGEVNIHIVDQAAGKKYPESNDDESIFKMRICVFIFVSFFFLITLCMVSFAHCYKKGSDNDVIRRKYDFPFGRHRFVDVQEMAAPKHEEVIESPNALSDEFINDVNSRAFVWEAGRNFAEDTPMAYIKKLMGVKRDHSMEVVANLLMVNKPILVGGRFFPTEFDARTKWPQCKSISEIRDQGGCGSCWAFGAAETMTDRQCIHKNENFHYSAEDLVSCCSTCGDGCDGGDPMLAFVHWRTDGIVSGGAYGSHQGCSPYKFESCGLSSNKSSCSDDIKTPECRKQCVASYNSTYDQDLRFAKSVYSLSHEKEILRELVKNGPMEAAFDVYEDFLHYKSGVYHHVTGSLLGGHAIRVLGFGEEGGVPYYLCANSWNYDWGNGGFFKIRRDQMYEEMVAGIPA